MFVVSVSHNVSFRYVTLYKFFAHILISTQFYLPLIFFCFLFSLVLFFVFFFLIFLLITGLYQQTFWLRWAVFSV